MMLLRIALAGVLLAPLPRTVTGGEATSTICTAQRICGTWVLQQSSSRDELDRFVPTTISPALRRPMSEV